jgi:D-3-phosphoglycerate dehydrogenase
MAKHRVVVTDYVFESFDVEREALAAIDAELDVYQCKTPEELLPHLPGTDAILNTYMPGVGGEVFDAATELQVVVRYGIGVDTIDVPAATSRGIMVVNVPDYCVEEVADHALALFLALARKVCYSNVKVKGGEWSLSYVKPLKGLTGMKAGVIGFGRIGRAIAQRLKAFGISVCFSDPAVESDSAGCARVDLDELLGTADAVFVQCPAVEATYHLIDRAAIEKMQRQPILVNTARGAIVDTDAVAWGLEGGKLSGAGLDLLEDVESVVEGDHPLKSCPNAILTPHSAWYSGAAIGKLQSKAVAEVVRALKGERPLSLLNPEVLERNN